MHCERAPAPLAHAADGVRQLLFLNGKQPSLPSAVQWVSELQPLLESNWNELATSPWCTFHQDVWASYCAFVGKSECMAAVHDGWTSCAKIKLSTFYDLCMSVNICQRLDLTSSPKQLVPADRCHNYSVNSLLLDKVE